MGIPTYLNPFKSRTPTTKLGRVGKALNPLNPFNARAILIEEAIRAVAGKYLPADTQRRLEYFSFGPQVGILANILDAGTANAQDDQKLIQESARIQRGMQRQKEIEALSPAEIKALSRSPVVDRSVPPVVDRPAPPVTREVSAPAPSYIPALSTQQPPPRSIPLTASPTPLPEEQNELAIEYTKQNLLGKAMSEGGELQRRLFEAGGGAGMAPEDFMAWVGSNPGVAYREMLRRESLVQ
jgi:hypothetical protein